MRRLEAQLIHDMRNTASVIRGAAEMLHVSHRTLSSVAVDDVTSMLVRRSDMLTRLLEDLATVNAIERGDLAVELQVVDVADAFRNVVAEYGDLVGQTIAVDIEPGTRVLGDPVRIVQILDNLLSNAVRYGGSAVIVRVWREDRWVHVSVADDGPGVAPELVETLFDLYSRGSGSRLVGGSGLGLAIVQQLCAVQGGSISYDGSAGATFTATLPSVPAVTVPLGQDAALQGHPVSFWASDDELADSVADYVATGLVAGEGVLIAVTDQHRVLIEGRLRALGVDLVEAERLGQYTALDADALHTVLKVDGHVDRQVFTEVVGGAVENLRARWVSFRVFGEIVDLYWREGDGHLSVELEDCWNDLRTRVPFPLYCGYEVSAAQSAVCGCHDVVLVA